MDGRPGADLHPGAAVQYVYGSTAAGTPERLVREGSFRGGGKTDPERSDKVGEAGKRIAGRQTPLQQGAGNGIRTDCFF
ncbi:hypothetical protein GCM10010319_59360 [Streptomyces blastmyceticus]|uniref:Uncharacterized protein n=1 Tax=Streptomyces blastmyceticus TaxID=68180 RepID=A0ABN0XUJ1_9ACTN